MTRINRRKFLLSSAAASVATSALSAPAVKTSASRPVVVSSKNGFTIKNGGVKSCVETAFDQIIEGADVLDALIAGVNIVELDPEDASVGYGGRPNADGVVQLDACCMHGPKSRLAGSLHSREFVRHRTWPERLWISLTIIFSLARGPKTSLGRWASRSRIT